MTSHLLTAVTFVAMTLGVIYGESAPAEAAPAPTERRGGWTTRVTQTATGAYVLGNPLAKVRLVEYLSMTCSHCAHFAAEGLPALKRDYIASGKVSLEFRNAVRDPYDLAGVLLARCTGPQGYFPTSEALLAKQGEWLARAAEFGEKEAEKLKDAPLEQALLATAKGVGLDTLAGVAPARLPGCFANKPEQERVSAMANEAWGERKIGGTPFFLINGVAVENANTWATLEPRLREALAK